MNEIPYTVYEEAQARADRRERRLVIAFVIALVLLFVSNAVWLRSWMSYDYADETVAVDTSGEGDANYIGEDGEIINGTDSGTKASAR